MPAKGLKEMLKDGGTVLIGEGYMWEFERRGYLKSGGFVPEVVLEHPELVRAMHQEFVHAGSDVVEAFTYYAHREKLRSIGREDDLEKLNRTALKIAREVADETGTLMAGNINGTGVYSTNDAESHKYAKNMFKEQVQWAVEGGCDFIIAETFCYLGEALIALEVIKDAGVPSVVTLTPYVPDVTLDFVPFDKACKMLEDAGADVVGLNCSRGPVTLMPLIKDIRKACKGPIAALPVPFRTNNKYKTFMTYKDPDTEESLYPINLTCHLCNRADVIKFAKEAKAIGVQYTGLCCGNAPNLFRELAEIYGRKPPASEYAPDVSNNILVGETGENINKEIIKIRKFVRGEITEEEIKEMRINGQI
ncbi:hypothetical protein ACF0H5_008166 [Mactra antiquata]